MGEDWLWGGCSGAWGEIGQLSWSWQDSGRCGGGGIGHSLEAGLSPACSLVGTHSYKFMSCVIKSFIFAVFHFFLIVGMQSFGFSP